MDNFLMALGPAFAAGLAIQQLLEIVGRLIDQLLEIVGPLNIGLDKQLILGLISLGAGLFLSVGAGLRVLEPLGIVNADFFDIIVTAFVISSGTESLNAIVKFLGYSKEGRKATAAAAKENAVRVGADLD
jgi:hypothetical protein